MDSGERPVRTRFENTDLYDQALVHSSFAHENGIPDNERLEFLGDAVLQLCATRLLYTHFS
ncbi:MAG: ribonuclease III, partial [Myxococcota bacterium]|nr:ribonuclease III [Myxococcota bacterium]